jgi:hypothetical protein
MVAKCLTSTSRALDLLVFECCPWRVPEADRQPVVGIHQADRDREIDQFLFDAGGIDVDYGLRHVPDAKLVVVTPGQQAPLGVTLSLERRLRLLDWAASAGSSGGSSECSWRP